MHKHSIFQSSGGGGGHAGVGGGGGLIQRLSSLSQIPFFAERRGCLLRMIGFSVFSHGTNLYLVRISVIANLTSIWANLRPMQILGPAPKGKYANLVWVFCASSENLSGSNFSGSGQYFGLWCRAWIGMLMLMFAGIVQFLMVICFLLFLSTRFCLATKRGQAPF